MRVENNNYVAAYVVVHIIVANDKMIIVYKYLMKG